MFNAFHFLTAITLPVSIVPGARVYNPSGISQAKQAQQKVLQP